jgi:hypothetical protein
MTTSAEASTDKPELQGRAPDFFIVGHPKSGTTALFEMLRVHPQIYMPVKEPWFLSPELRSPVGSRASRTRPETLEGYLSLFKDAEPQQRVGEASPSYLRSHTAAARIAVLQPNARIIAILREPASFLRSFHLQCVQSHVETQKDLRRAIALEEPRRRGRLIPRRCPRPEALLYSEHVRYVEQLRRFHEVFPPEHVHVVIYDDFLRDNEATVRGVLRFLDVDDSAPVEVMSANPTVRLRSRGLDDLVHTVSVGTGPASRALKEALKALTPRGLRGRALRVAQRRLVHASPDAPDEQLALELRHRFKGEVVALSDYLDRDLVTLWGYDDVP